MVDCGADAAMKLLTLSSALRLLVDDRGWREKEIHRTRYIRIRKSSRSILFLAVRKYRTVINF